jgi:GNAT superfamily N-acetyltransferase
MEFEYLAENTNAIPTLANWYFNEWGHIEKGNTLDNVIKKLHGYLHVNEIPLIIMAINEGEILGAAQLKYREMDIYPEREHWLGGVYVSKKHRGNNIAEKIILKVISDAKKLNVKTLYLQTEDKSGGLYQHLGWHPIEQVNYRGIDVLVMENQICV